MSKEKDGGIDLMAQVPQAIWVPPPCDATEELDAETLASCGQ